MDNINVMEDRRPKDIIAQYKKYIEESNVHTEDIGAKERRYYNKVYKEVDRLAKDELQNYPEQTSNYPEKTLKDYIKETIQTLYELGIKLTMPGILELSTKETMGDIDSFRRTITKVYWDTL